MLRVNAQQMAPLCATAQADMQIRLASSSTYLGDDIYNAHGSRQTAEGATPRGVACVYHLKVQNDAAQSYTYTVTGGGNSAHWTVRYFDALRGGNEITAAVTGAGKAVALAPRAFVEWRLEVTPDPNSSSNGLEQTMVRAALHQQGHGPSAGVDLVKATTRLGAFCPTPTPRPTASPTATRTPVPRRR